MYEEEDDDLPLQYRRLTAQFNTTDPTFNRRLAAYLTNHVAINNAMNQAMGNQFNGQFGDNPMNQNWGQGFQNPMQQQMQQNMQQNMWQQQMQQQQQQQFNQQMMPPMMPNNNNNNFRQSPYPQPFNMQMPSQSYRPVHNRTSSTHPTMMSQSPLQQQRQQQPTPAMTAEEQRRMSAPAQPVSVAPSPKSSGLSAAQRTTSAASLPSLTTQTTQTSTTNKTSPSDINSTSPLAQGNLLTSPFAQGMFNQGTNMDFGPLTNTLPAETQMFLGANVGGPAMNELFSNPLGMNSGEKARQQPFYSYNPNNFNINKGRNMHPSFDGMSQTLAPGALTGDAFSWSTPQSATTMSGDSVSTPSFNGALSQSFNQGMNDMSKFNQYGFQSPMAQPSGFVTPGEAEWATYIDSSNWDDNTVTTTT